MLENIIRTDRARARIVSVATALALVVSACGATAAQTALGEPEDVARDSTNSTVETQISAGTLDYDTARHMGRLDVGVGSFSLDYDTAQYLGRLEAGVGSSSLDYDTARHIGTLSAP
jgi:curli biogenesis system outer membrane secretion channel CsgG